MGNKSRQQNLIKERMSVLLVAFCCFIIANSHFFVSLQDDASCDQKELLPSEKDHQDQEHQTFLDVATDAVVVPFATIVAQNTMQLIYEIVGFEVRQIKPMAAMPGYPGHFLEILLEQIIAPNAP